MTDLSEECYVSSGGHGVIFLASAMSCAHAHCWQCHQLNLVAASKLHLPAHSLKLCSFMPVAVGILPQLHQNASTSTIYGVDDKLQKASSSINSHDGVHRLTTGFSAQGP